MTVPFPSPMPFALAALGSSVFPRLCKPASAISCHSLPHCPCLSLHCLIACLQLAQVLLLSGGPSDSQVSCPSVPCPPSQGRIVCKAQFLRPDRAGAREHCLGMPSSSTDPPGYEVIPRFRGEMSVDMAENMLLELGVDISQEAWTFHSGEGMESGERENKFCFHCTECLTEASIDSGLRQTFWVDVTALKNSQHPNGS